MAQGMSNADYHAHKAISKSKLDAARKSGQHLHDMLYGPPRESTAAFDIGTVLHASALPGENADEIAVRMPKGMDKRTKDGRAFVAEHKGKIILVVGHSNTVPVLIANLGASKKVPPIQEDEYDNIYLISIPWFGKTKTIRLRFGEPYIPPNPAA